MTKEQNKVNINYLILLFGLLVSFLGLVTSFVNIIESKKSFTILIIGVCVIVFWFLYGEKNKQIESFGIKRYKYKGIKRALITIALWITLISAIAFTYLLLSFLNFNLWKSEKCVFDKSKIGIGISNFSEERSDNFSSLVREYLKEENLPDSIYDIQLLKRNYFNNISNPGFITTIDSLGLNSGMIISGKRNVSDGLFYCKIRLINFYLNSDTINNNILTIRNPNVDEFSIDYQAQLLVDFILGIIKYRQNDLLSAEELFVKCISRNKNPNNKIFESNCRTYLGNIYSKNDTNKAIKEYELAVSINKNKQATYNIIILYLQQGNYMEAEKYLNESENLNDADILKIKKLIQALKLKGLGKYKPKKSTKIIAIPPSGKLIITINDTTKIPIEYSKVEPYEYKDHKFLIFTSVDRNLGILDSDGYLISVAKFKDWDEAIKFIKTNF